MANQRNPMMAQQARKRKKSLEEIQKEMRKKNLGVEFKKILRKADENLSKVDKGFMKDPKNTEKIVESVIQNQPFEPAKISAASRREGASIFNKMAKGGRAGYRMGGKCKLAKKGKGRAYGKNS